MLVRCFTIKSLTIGKTIFDECKCGFDMTSLGCGKNILIMNVDEASITYQQHS